VINGEVEEEETNLQEALNNSVAKDDIKYIITTLEFKDVRILVLI
jgi:hypothetical protein